MTSLFELIETARRIHEIESPEERTRFNGAVVSSYCEEPPSPRPSPAAAGEGATHPAAD